MASTYGKASKVAKVAGLSGNDRRSTVTLLTPVSEAPHSAPFWQVKALLVKCLGGVEIAVL